MPGPNRIIIDGMSGAGLHAIFDIAAWLAAAAAGWWLQRVQRTQLHARPFPSQSFELPYLAALLFGAGIGAYLFGALNLWLSGLPGIARSVEGALAGGIVAIEIYKCARRHHARAPARASRCRSRSASRSAASAAILAGLDDFTYGTPTSLPWAHDFGDGISRHPVQLYESLAMAAFAVVYICGACCDVTASSIDNGFYLALGFYGAAALHLGVHQALRRADRSVHAVSSAVRRHPRLRRRDDRDRAHSQRAAR